jgi:hypothetical protein
LVAVSGPGLEDDLPDPSVDVELIDEVAAEGGPKRLEDVVHGDAEDLRPVAVDVEIDLRCRSIERAEHGGQLGLLIGRVNQRAHGGGEVGGRLVAGGLELILEAAGRAEPDDRRQIEREDVGARNARRLLERVAAPDGRGARAQRCGVAAPDGRAACSPVGAGHGGPASLLGAAAGRVGSAARLGRLGLGPGGGWHCNRRRNWHGGGLFVLLPVAAVVEPVGVGVLAVRIPPLANPQTRHTEAHSAVPQPGPLPGQKIERRSQP